MPTARRIWSSMSPRRWWPVASSMTTSRAARCARSSAVSTTTTSPPPLASRCGRHYRVRVAHQPDLHGQGELVSRHPCDTAWRRSHAASTSCQRRMDRGERARPRERGRLRRRASGPSQPLVLFAATLHSRPVALATPRRVRSLWCPHPRPEDDLIVREDPSLLQLCAPRPGAGRRSRPGLSRRPHPSRRARELRYDKVSEVLLQPDVLLAGEAGLAGHNTPSDELLGAQLARLVRRVDQADGERRRLADLYQAGIIDVDELRRRGAEISARRAALETERAELAARHRELAGENQLRHRLQDFAARVGDGLANLDFDGRQRLMRLVIEQVRVTGWQVEIRLRIPLGGDPTDGDDGGPNPSHSPGPKRQPGRPRPRARPVSNELRLRSADHAFPH